MDETLEDLVKQYALKLLRIRDKELAPTGIAFAQADRAFAQTDKALELVKDAIDQRNEAFAQTKHVASLLEQAIEQIEKQKEELAKKDTRIKELEATCNFNL